MSDLTRADLIEFKEDIKEHLDNKVDPIIADQKAMKLSLYGREGRNGVVGDVNDLKASRRFMKWLGGGALGTGIGAWLEKFWH